MITRRDSETEWFPVAMLDGLGETLNGCWVRCCFGGLGSTLIQGYINQVERSGKKVGITRNLAATFLYRLCLGGEESGQKGTENVKTCVVFGFVPWSMIFYLTRALLGGGGRLNAPPLRFFEDSKKTAARSAAGFLSTLSPIFSATFVKISTQCHVRSGHQVRSSDSTTK